MLRIGCHLSPSKGFTHMGEVTLELGGDCFQFFTRNPRGLNQAKSWDPDDIATYLALAKGHHFANTLAHAPYVMNACASRPDLVEKTFVVMCEDLAKLEAIPGALYNFHPGAHVGQGSEKGVTMIAQMLNRVLAGGYRTPVLLETMAGKGTEMGRSFEELAAIIGQVDKGLRASVGVCLDTCHVWDGGYDLAHDLEGVLRSFDEVIGLERLRAVHCNDSKNPCGAHKDRHERIGEGHIGLDAFCQMVNHPCLRDLPFYLETPNDLDGYAREIALLKGLQEA